MNKIETFQQFLTTQNIPIPVGEFILNLCISALLSLILAKIYIEFGVSISNRRLFSKTFILITMTTLLIITIVKSSLALSLGLVGALSIVRFRAPIKEPEELAYLFLAIAVGLGLGANQRVITMTAFTIICIIIILRNYKNRKEEDQNMYLTISGGLVNDLSLDNIVNLLKEYCSMVKLKRIDSSKEFIEASFLVEFEQFEQLQHACEELARLNDTIKITFIDNNRTV